MKILIAKENENIIRKFKRNVVFEESTRNTSTFEITESQFQKLAQTVKENGYNPYALMYF